MQKTIAKDQFGNFEIFQPQGFIESPAVSVVMSAFNGCDFLEESIKSILEQSFGKFEFIIVNDGSKDNTLEIILQYQENCNKILVINQENIGLTKSLNRAIELVRGRYIARQDSDDKSISDRLKKQFDFLENNPDYFLVGCRHNIIDESGCVPGEPEMPVPIQDMEIKAVINKYNPFIHSFVMFRNDTGKIKYFYDPAYKYSQDIELWIRIRKYYKMHNLPDVLGLSRQWPGMISEEKMKLQRRYSLRVKKRLMFQSFFDSGYWFYLLKDISAAYLPDYCRQIYRKLSRKNNDT